jgi:adenylate cyclase
MEAPDVERRLAAILAADVEAYSRLMHSDEDATLSTLSARRLVVDALISEYRGRIANTAGDSVLAEFASVLDAVSCAVEIQTAMEQANEIDADRTMRFRIGINVGDVMLKDNDIFGDGVNVATRLEGLAEAGGVCVSRGVRDHLRHRMNFVFDDLGEQLVKNIAHPIRAYRLRLGEVAVNVEAVATETSLLADTEMSADNEVALELSLWESVKDGGQAELAAYLQHYPQGTFASLARTRQNAAEHKLDVEPPNTSDVKNTFDPLDLAFWDAIKESQTPEELAAYIESHPDGHFTALARTRLSPPAHGNSPEPAVEQADAPGDGIELAFWQAICDVEDPSLLDAYLVKFPDGQFAVIARARLEAMRGGDGKG